MLPEPFITIITWVILLLLPPVAGYALAKIRSSLARLTLMALLLPLPVILLTIAMLLSPPAPPSFSSWWIAGMIMISPATVAWAVLSAGGYFVGRMEAR